MLPNAARYQLRYTPIVIKLWSCKWSNLWSNTFLTAIFCFPNRPKSARLKGFRRLSLSYSANTVYAPKYIIKSFSGHFRHFIAISSGKHLLFGTLVSTVSMCSGNDCGMKCGRKRYSPNKKFCSGSLLSVVCYLWNGKKSSPFYRQFLSRSRQRKGSVAYENHSCTTELRKVIKKS